MLDIEPPASLPCRGSVIAVQPLGEESNLSRRVVVAMAGRLAAAGWRVSIPDLYGCGDSDGDSDQPDLATWQSDLSAFAERLESLSTAPGGLVIWGLRHGCHLAVDLWLRRRVAEDTLVLWQPPGPTKIRPRPQRPPEPSSHDIVTLHACRFRADLVAQLEALPLAPATAIRPDSRVLLVHCSRQLAAKVGAAGGGNPAAASAGRAAAGPAPKPAIELLADAWREAGARTTCERVTAGPFWSSLEPMIPDEAFAATLRFLGADA